MSRAKVTSYEKARRILADGWVSREEVRRSEGLPVPEACQACGETIRMQIRRGTAYCCQRCEEMHTADLQAMADYATEASEREPS